MDLEPALLLMEKGCSDLVIDALIRFGEEDWRICWLGCSAIWNLARPEEFRHKFNPQTVDLIRNPLSLPYFQSLYCLSQNTRKV